MDDWCNSEQQKTWSKKIWAEYREKNAKIA